MRKMLLLLALVCFVCLPTVWADSFVPIGPPQASNSWAQMFNESGAGPYTSVTLLMLSGTLELPAFRDFTAAGWANTGWDVTGIRGRADGTTTTDNTFNIFFNGSSSEPVSFLFAAWNNDQFVEAARADWNGGWTITGADQSAVGTLGDYNVPDGGVTLMLLGGAFVGLETLRRRFRA